NITELCWNNKTRANPSYEVKDIGGYWDHPGNVSSDWKTPDGLFWICGKRAYYSLPKKWRGTCTIWIIQPAFFLPPKSKRGSLLASY
ncbi:ENR1 protein, partial [Caloenas nicobarica]|nr:ENR1 protein [Caloenas nicobarica]